MTDHEWGQQAVGVIMIDWGRVRELRTEIGDKDFDEVAQLFLEETDEVAANMVGNTSPQAIESALHFLKGSALNLSFIKLAALCQTGEKAASLGAITGIDLRLVVSVYQASKAAFDAGERTGDAA
jgi:HPt (histidine-containing phosphotransfer) domain-containing protein